MKNADYLLLVPPSDPVKSTVTYYKYWLDSKVGSFTARYSDPHLSLAGFTMNVCKEKNLVSSLFRATAEERPFSLSTNNFGFFPNSTTIFIQIEGGKMLLFKTTRQRFWRKARSFVL